MSKRTVRLTESELKKVITESIKNIFSELNLKNTMDNTIKFILRSPMNGNMTVTVPYQEFVNAEYKNDYLWKKCAEQNDIKLMRNGYFEVSNDSPKAEEVRSQFGY